MSIPRALACSTAGVRTPVVMRPLDKRGAIAAVFGLTAALIAGFSGLATEGGSWYLTRRDAQNSADLAAIAGAKRLAVADTVLLLPLASAQAQGVIAARDAGMRNGFSNGQNATSVVVNIPPLTGPYAGNPRAVEVIIRRDRPRLLSRLFLGDDSQRIAVRGVAAVQTQGPACVLALQGGLTIGGNSTTSAPECVMASNATGPNAIRVNGNSAEIIAQTLNAAGGCNGCDRSGVILQSPFSEYGTGVDNPFEWVERLPLPPMGGSNCDATPGNQQLGNGAVWSPSAATLSGRSGSIYGPYYVFCQNLSLRTSATVDLRPGTYFFRGSDLDVQSGTLRCSTCAAATGTAGTGVTLIFAPGANGRTGIVNINSNGIVQLKAPDSGPYAGILMYRVQSTSMVGGVAEVTINGNTLTRLTGGLYFPNADVRFNGNANIGEAGCLVLVGGAVDLTGTAGAATTCSGLNPDIVPQIQVARLLE